MNKKTISIIFAYVGVLTGAGLASGQEIMQYFTSFGKSGFFGLVGIAILHIFVGGIILQLGSHFIAKSHIDVLEEVSNSKLLFNGICNACRSRFKSQSTIWIRAMGRFINMYNFNYCSWYA